MATIGAGVTIGTGVTITPFYTVVTDGLVVSLDANEFSSSPGAGAAWDNQVTGPSFTLPNGATYSPSNGGILTFDRASTQSAHGDSLASALTTFTAETWVKFNTLDLTSGNATCTITEVYASTPINYTIGCGMLGNPALWQGGYFDGGAWHLAGTLVPVVNTWYCMTVTYDGNNVKFFVNGELNDTVASAVTPGSSGSGIHVGERWDGAYLPQSFLDGSVPVVHLYDRALSSAEVKENFLANEPRFPNPPIITSGLVLNLDAGDPDSYPGTGTTWSDLSGNNNDATMTNPVWTNTNSGYFTFNGTASSYGAIANSASMSPTSISWETWVQIPSAPVSSYSWVIRNGWSGAPWFFGYNSSNYWTLAINDNNTTYDQTQTSLATAGWHQVLGTYDGSEIILYVNGTQVGTPVAFAAGNIVGYGSPTIINGGSTSTVPPPDQQLWTGDIAVLRMYNRALTSAEVLQNFNANKSRFGL